MTPQYVFALGGTDVVKKIFDLLNSQEEVVKQITNKEKTKQQYMVGEDLTFASDRPVAKDN